MIETKAKVGKVIVRAVKTKADGTMYDLGVISARHPNPILNWLWQLRIKINGILTYKSRAC